MGRGSGNTRIGGSNTASGVSTSRGGNAIGRRAEAADALREIAQKRGLEFSSTEFSSMVSKKLPEGSNITGYYVVADVDPVTNSITYYTGFDDYKIPPQYSMFSGSELRDYSSIINNRYREFDNPTEAERFISELAKKANSIDVGDAPYEGSESENLRRFNQTRNR